MLAHSRPRVALILSFFILSHHLSLMAFHFISFRFRWSWPNLDPSVGFRLVSSHIISVPIVSHHFSSHFISYFLSSCHLIQSFLIILHNVLVWFISCHCITPCLIISHLISSHPINRIASHRIPSQTHHLPSVLIQFLGWLLSQCLIRLWVATRA